MLDIVRTKSLIGHCETIRCTCERLGLSKVNTRRVLPIDPALRGMLKHLGSVALWTIAQAQAVPGVGVYHLHPPTKGYPRKVPRTGELDVETYGKVISRMVRKR